MATNGQSQSVAYVKQETRDSGVAEMAQGIMAEEGSKHVIKAEEDVEMKDAPAQVAPVAPSMMEASAGASPGLMAPIAPMSHTSPSTFDIPAASMPKFPEQFAKDFAHTVRKQLTDLIGRYRLNPDGDFSAGAKFKPLTPEETTFVISHLKALLAAPRLSAAHFKQMNVKDLLLMIMGRHPTRPTRCPPELVAAAEKAFARFDAEGWGEVHKSTSPSNSPTLVKHSRRPSKIDSVAGPARVSKSTSPDSASRPTAPGLTIFPPPNHPIYGKHGIMHDILVKHGKTRSYQVRHQKRTHCAFGHNDIPVGQWWPIRKCANRDGAHGPVVAGISRSKDEGVWSVVINSSYEDVDVDNGEVVWYSMPGSNDNKDKNSVTGDYDAEAMRYTQRLGKPIRVLRGKGAGWPGRPPVGFRYDGLYHITDEDERINVHGARFTRFKLERLRNGQPPLDSVRARPTAQEKRDEEKVKDGYY